MKTRIPFLMIISLLTSPVVFAEMDHSEHQNMKMSEKDCSDPVHAQMENCKASSGMEKEPMKMDQSNMEMEHSKHKMAIPVSDGSLDEDVPLPYPAEKMEDDPLLTKFMLEQLEVQDVSGDNPITWEAEAWIGKDLNKLWLKTEGERVDSAFEEAELQMLYSRAIAPFWDLQAGFRKDFEPADREWIVAGIKGLAPYFFETDLAFFIGKSGRTAARLQGEYELLLTQKTILTPEIEINLYGKDDQETGVGSGLSDIRTGLRLRHEFVREFAPYIGIEWRKEFGDTADFTRAQGEETEDTYFVAGLRIWF